MHVIPKKIYSLRNIPIEPSSEACPNSGLSRTVLKDFNLGPVKNQIWLLTKGHKRDSVNDLASLFLHLSLSSEPGEE